MSLEAEYNIIADRLADTARQQTEMKPFLQGYKAGVIIQGNPVTTKFAKTMRHAYYTPAMATYFKHRHRWSHQKMESINGTLSQILLIPSDHNRNFASLNSSMDGHSAPSRRISIQQYSLVVNLNHYPTSCSVSSISPR